jgi:hypothetical protein
MVKLLLVEESIPQWVEQWLLPFLEVALVHALSVQHAA